MTFSLHPLFYIFGLYFAFTGKVFSFLTITFCAVVHEFGHAFAAERLGYKLKKITLMPYGAVISGETGGMTAADEIYTVIFGPLVNLFTGLFIIALWWLFPMTYPYTELAATANFSLFFVNLLPAFPLDGGRLLLCLLTKPLGRKKAMFLTRAIGVLLSVSLFGLFVCSCFSSVNFSLAFFGAFLLSGALEKKARRQIYPPYRPTFCGKRAKSENDKTACRKAGVYGERPLRRHGRREFIRNRNLLSKRKIIKKTASGGTVRRIKNEDVERAALTRLFSSL